MPLYKDTVSKRGSGTAQRPNSGHRERLRKKFLSNGIDSFEQHEILELLLFSVISQKDTNRLAHKLIDAFGSLAAVLDAPPKVLAAACNLSDATASYVAMLAPMLSYCREKSETCPTFKSVESVVTFAAKALENKTYEKSFVLCLDPSARLIGMKVFCDNDATSVKIDVRDVVQTATLFESNNVVLVHNHARGIATPSGADREFTKSVFNTLKGLNIRLCDHIIYAEGGFYSFARAGVIDHFCDEYIKSFYSSANSGKVAQADFIYEK